MTTDAGGASQADGTIPICDVHIQTLKFAREKHSIMGDEIPRLFDLVHSLL
jgi:hypothetical protein